MAMYECEECGCIWECASHSLGGTMCPDCSSFEVVGARPDAVPTPVPPETAEIVGHGSCRVCMADTPAVVCRVSRATTCMWCGFEYS